MIPSCKAVYTFAKARFQFVADFWFPSQFAELLFWNQWNSGCRWKGSLYMLINLLALFFYYKNMDTQLSIQEWGEGSLVSFQTVR